MGLFRINKIKQYKGLFLLIMSIHKLQKLCALQKRIGSRRAACAEQTTTRIGMQTRERGQARFRAVAMATTGGVPARGSARGRRLSYAAFLHS